MVDFKSVFSSHVHSIGHDPENDELHVNYQNGARVVYSGVGPEKAKQIMGSSSIGSALHELVKGKHEHKYK